MSCVQTQEIRIRLYLFLDWNYNCNKIQMFDINMPNLRDFNIICSIIGYNYNKIQIFVFYSPSFKDFYIISIKCIDVWIFFFLSISLIIIESELGLLEYRENSGWIVNMMIK